MSNDGMSSRLRLDLVTKIISADDATRTVQFALTPNPKRYEWQTVDGEECLYDKLDNLIIPKSLYLQLMSGIAGHPISFEPQSVGSAADYVNGRREHIFKALKGQESERALEDPSQEFLNSLSTDVRSFVILSLDLVGSTKLATSLPPESYSRVIQTVLYEISHVVPMFNGHVLKYTGDGVIVYFPAPSFISKNDLALDCALTLRRLVRDALNPMLTESGFNEVDVRIGLDSGEAAVIVIGSPDTKQQADLIGAVVSLACKIQSLAPVGGIALGHVTLKNLHTDWRLRCAELLTSAEWQYMDKSTNKPYKLYFVEQF